MIGKEYKWYVIYTRPHHEKRLNDAVTRLWVETYLPLNKTFRTWSDRKKMIETPLFPNYLFVRASCREYVKILEHQSVIGFVKNHGEPSVVPDLVLSSIKKVVEEKMEYTIASVNPSKGSFVDIISGPLTGFSGEIVESSGSSYLIIELKQINQSFLVKIDRNTIAIK
jgi:transcription antitermination factor NusG